MTTKTLASSKALKVPRKEKAWIMTPRPGPHKGDESIPLGVLLREYLGLVENKREARYLLSNNSLLVDGRRIKDENFPIGLLDILSVPEMDKQFIILVDHNGRLYPKEIEKKAAGTKLCKVINKTMLKGGKLQLNLNDGKNILINAKDSKKYPGAGTVEISLPDQKIVDFTPLEKDKIALVAKGRHAGKIGRIVEITKSGLNLKSLTTIQTDDEKLVTDTNYIIIVGDKKSKI
jgi:small subunit ribosomal protein S4e